MATIGVLTSGLLAYALLFIVHSGELGVRGEDLVTATCTVERNSGLAPVYGTIKLSQKASGGETTVEVKLHGFNTSAKVTQHGFHVHEFGDLSQSCNAAGAHYNPGNVQHAAPNDTIRHVGDLGNVDVSVTGEVDTIIKDSTVSLVGGLSVINRAFVVHETFDDLGRGGFNDSKTTGHAGKRYGCCVILKDPPSNASVRWDPTASLLWGALALMVARRFV